MKKSLKILPVFCLTVLLTVFLCLTAFAANGIADFAVSTASAAASGDLGAVKWFHSPNNGKYYIFLPNGASDDSLTVYFQADAPVMCGDVELTSGEATDVFASGSASLTCGDAVYQVVVMESQNIGTVYINTQSGSLSAIHADKEYKEPGDILILDKDGNVQYDGALEYMKGRGNSTWLGDKKPYNIKLDKKANLFDMGKSKKWCLLANAADGTLIRNSLSYDLAQTIGVDVTSDTAQVNLYVNGSYLGVYIVTEKVEIDENRIDIYDLEGNTEDVNTAELDSYPLAGAQNSREWGSVKYADIPNNPEVITGGYLLELEKIYRYVNEASGFITDIGQAVVVKTPEFASKAQVEYISTYYQEFEDALYSPTGYNDLGKHYSEYVDVESLAEMYIVDEFGANFDGCSSSFYLYKDVDGKLTAGPAWDFDLAFAVYASNDLINHVQNLADPNLLYMQTCFIGNHSENKNALLAQAFSHNDFQEVVQRVWNEQVKAYYDTFLNNVDTFSTDVQSSAIMNAVRWNIFGTTDPAAIANHYQGQVASVRNYITARYAFLSEAYAEDTYFVKYDIGKYGGKLVHDTTIYRDGDTATVPAAPVSTDDLMLFAGWNTEPDGSGDTYQPGDELVVEGNTKLYAQWKQDSSFQGLLKAFVRMLNAFFAKINSLFEKIFG